MHKAVVLGSNYYIGLSIIRSLGEENIPVVVLDYDHKKAYGAASKYVSESYEVPHYKNDSEGLIEFLITYSGKQNDKPVLFPTADNYVSFIDDHLEVLSEYYLFPMTEKNIWQSLMDKKALSGFTEAFEVITPESLSPEEKNFDLLFDSVIGFPCLVKPTDSAAFVKRFRKKMFKCSHRAELNHALKEASDSNLQVIVQRIIPGRDDCMFTYDAYLNQNSEVTHYMTCQKIRQFPVHFGASSFTVQKHVPEIHLIGAKFLSQVQYKGFAEIEFKWEAKTQQYYLIEVNVRTTTLNEMLKKAGINFPYVMYAEMTGKPLEPCGITATTNIAFCYHIEDVISIRHHIKEKDYTLFEIIKSLLRKKVYAIWSIKDPKPYFAYWKSKLSR